MITDADIRKLKAVFATKDDIISIKKDMVSMKSDIISIKKDMVSMKSDIVSIKKDMVSVKTDIVSIKKDMVSMEVRLRRDIVKDVVDYLQNNIITILNEHERRLDRLEKHVGGFPAIA